MHRTIEFHRKDRQDRKEHRKGHCSIDPSQQLPVVPRTTGTDHAVAVTASVSEPVPDGPPPSPREWLPTGDGGICVNLRDLRDLRAKCDVRWILRLFYLR